MLWGWFLFISSSPFDSRSSKYSNLIETRSGWRLRPEMDEDVRWTTKLSIVLNRYSISLLLNYKIKHVNSLYIIMKYIFRYTYYTFDFVLFWFDNKYAIFEYALIWYILTKLSVLFIHALLINIHDFICIKMNDMISFIISLYYHIVPSGISMVSLWYTCYISSFLFSSQLLFESCVSTISN